MRSQASYWTADDSNEQSGSAQDSNALSMVSRVQERVEELRRSFGLPREEMFMDEFYCALHKKILLQGRMYVFEKYVCFYSNLFGWVKRKVIPLVEVTEVSKKRNYGFPNSIQINWKGKKQFFTSFLSRDDAFTLIVNAWGQAKLGKAGTRTVSEPALLRPTDDDDAEEPPLGSPSTSDGLQAHQRACSEQAEISSEIPKSSMDPDCPEHDTESDPDDEDAESWMMQQGPPPMVPSDMNLLREGNFDVPVREFFQKVLSSESIFLEEYHKDRGDQRYRLSQWQRHSGLDGVVRHATFVSPVKTPGGFRIGLISPKETECNQNQRYRVYEGSTLVFETSQVMKDIPYGDNFTVETHWNITSTSSGCHVAVHGHVPFVRHVISPIRMMIESSVMKELRESTARLFSLLSSALVEMTSPSVPEPSMGERSWSGILSENLDEALARQDLREKLLSLLRERKGDSERKDLMTGASLEGEFFGEQEVQHKPVSPQQSYPSFPWSFFQQWSLNVVMVVTLVLVLLFQLISFVMWLYPPYGQCRQYGSMYMPPDRMHWQQSLTYMSQDLTTLQDRLEVLAQGIGLMMEQVDNTKAS